MIKEELAAMLNGQQYLNELTPEIRKLSSENNLLIIFGRSDDLCEFRGAIDEEFECYDGGKIDCKRLPELIEAIWEPYGLDCSWAYETKLPHAKFEIYEDDELYCIGIVIDLKEITKMPRPAPSPEYLAQKMLEASQKDDTEQSHIEMDSLMAETLKLLGYSEAVKIFEKADKWYV